MTYGDGREPELLVKISFDFYIDITSHILATDVAVVGTVGAAAGIRARYAGVDRHGYHTVSHRDGISSGGNTSWVHAGKDCRGWWKGIRSCRFVYLRL